MAIAYVVKKSFEPVICSPNSVEMSSGDLARLALDTVADAGLPVDIIGVVQTPVLREKMFNDTLGCVVVGYSYTIAYDTEDLLGAVGELTPDLVLTFGCVSCCQVLDERLAAEIAARVAADALIDGGTP